MNDGFEFKVLSLSRPLSLEQIGERVAGVPALAGQFTPLGRRGARFIPDNLAWPATFFAGDGRTVEVVLKDLDLVDIEEYLCLLARALDSPILSEELEYS